MDVNRPPVASSYPSLNTSAVLSKQLDAVHFRRDKRVMVKSVTRRETAGEGREVGQGQKRRFAFVELGRQ